jgi:hypothetical protein
VPDPELVATHVRRLGADARAAVVADCWAAAGHAVDHNGSTVRVRRAGHERRLSTVPDPDADRVLDATDVRDALLYRVARADADRIAARHLGAPLDALRPPLARRVAGAVRAPVTAVAVVVLGLALGGGVGPTAGGGGLPGPDYVDATPAPETETATPAPAVPPGVAEVPGLGRTGVTDLAALAAAHERERPTAYVARAWTARVASNYGAITREITLRVDGDRYRADVVTERPGERTDRATVYGDTEGRWVGTRRDDGWTVERLGANETGPANVDPATLGGSGVRNALATPETNVSGPVEDEGRTAYRVVGRGVPANARDAVESYRVEAYVRPDGFVYAVTVEYTLFGPRISDRRLEWRYVEAGATVETPVWRPGPGSE